MSHRDIFHRAIFRPNIDPPALYANASVSIFSILRHFGIFEDIWLRAIPRYHQPQRLIPALPRRPRRVPQEHAEAAAVTRALRSRPPCRLIQLSKIVPLYSEAGEQNLTPKIRRRAHFSPANSLSACLRLPNKTVEPRSHEEHEAGDQLQETASCLRVFVVSLLAFVRSFYFGEPAPMGPMIS
jgi:hypothetical protein